MVEQDGPPADEYGAWADATPAELAYLRAVVLLSPTLEIAESLLRGEHVPTELLDQEQLRRFNPR